MKQSNLARIFKALSNEQRLKLFLMIYEGCLSDPKDSGKHSGKKGSKKSKAESKTEKTCCGAMEKAFTAACCCMNLSRSTISHHFNDLQDAGLIKATRKGQAFSCEVNESAIKEIQQFLK